MLTPFFYIIYYLINPSLRNNAIGSGSAPLNFLYNSIGSTVLPFESMQFLKDDAVSLLKIPLSLNSSTKLVTNRQFHTKRSF